MGHGQMVKRQTKHSVTVLQQREIEWKEHR